MPRSSWTNVVLYVGSAVVVGGMMGMIVIARVALADCRELRQQVAEVRKERDDARKELVAARKADPLCTQLRADPAYMRWAGKALAGLPGYFALRVKAWQLLDIAKALGVNRDNYVYWRRNQEARAAGIAAAQAFADAGRYWEENIDDPLLELDRVWFAHRSELRDAAGAWRIREAIYKAVGLDTRRESDALDAAGLSWIYETLRERIWGPDEWANSGRLETEASAACYDACGYFCEQEVSRRCYRGPLCAACADLQTPTAFYWDW